MSSAILAMTGPAIHALEEVRTTLHALGRTRRLGRNYYRLARLLFLERRRECLYICDQIGALLLEKRLPRRHAAGMNPTCNRVVEVTIQWKASAWSGPALKNRFGEIPRLRVQIGRAFSSTVSIGAMTEDAIPLIKRFAVLCIAGQFVDVALLRG